MDKIVSCDVSFVKDNDIREMLQEAIDVMDNTENAWDWILDYELPKDTDWTFTNMINTICMKMKYQINTIDQKIFLFRTLKSIAIDPDEWIKKYKENQY
jgi:hypothetical protein